MNEWAESEVVRFHLRELSEDLQRLIDRIQSEEVSDTDLYLSIAHLYHHLNTAWNARNFKSLEDPLLLVDSTFFELASFPKDLDPWNLDFLPMQDK